LVAVATDGFDTPAGSETGGTHAGPVAVDDMYPALRIAAILAVACLPAAATAAVSAGSVPVQSLPHASQRSTAPSADGLSLVANLDYSNGTFQSWSVARRQATLLGSFRIGRRADVAVNGVSLDASGLLYTGIDSTNGKPCAACFEVLKSDGTVVAKVPAPALGGSQSAHVDDLALDASGKVYIADTGQVAAYFYTPTASGFSGPTLIETGANPASIAVSPNGQLVFIQGNCGFGEARVYTLGASGTYQPGNCFGIGTVALIGGSADDAGDVATPVDGAIGLVSISNPNGQGMAFSLPGRLTSVGGVAFSPDASLLYVADATRERVYAYARPSGGWVSGATPAIAGRAAGFKQLNIIAVPE